MVTEERRDSDAMDKFPVGMRVLVVDDDPTCLKTLEAMLRHCQYHVTVTTQATSALKLLRENKGKFDLVISDVHMPDMDGFELLEQVGLEMDLPVIMISGNGDTETVMKGITHGACNYILKPVRIEMLKTIWQHVVRRRGFGIKGRKSSDASDNEEKLDRGNYENVQGPDNDKSSDGISRKRKEQIEDSNDSDDNRSDNEDASAKKKSRMKWDLDLHCKFLAAVYHLGIDKAVPKRILEQMNDKRLTRENVASHLQKYRISLKRCDGLRSYNAISGPGQLSTPVPSLQGGILGRFNRRLQDLSSSSGIIRTNHVHSTNNAFNDLGKVPRFNLPGAQQSNLLQGIPTSMKTSHLQQCNMVQESTNPLACSFSDVRFPAGNSNNSLLAATTSNFQALQPQHQHNQLNRFTNRFSYGLTSSSSDSFEMKFGVSPHLTYLGSDTCTGTDPLTRNTTDTFPVDLPFSHELQDYVPSISSHDVCSGGALVSQSFPGPLMERDILGQANMLGGNTMIMPTTDNDCPFVEDCLLEPIPLMQGGFKPSRQDSFDSLVDAMLNPV